MNKHSTDKESELGEALISGLTGLRDMLKPPAAQGWRMGPREGDYCAIETDPGGKHVTDYVHIRNAPLIIAAPALYAALRGLVMCHAEGGFVEPNADVLDTARAALALADTGEQTHA